MSTLYRKYRPSNFSEIVDQKHIKITIENQIKTNTIGHAYLFCGPRAVGKTSLARVIAKSLNCEKRLEKETDPCNQCSVCAEINKGAGLDIIEIDAASHTGVDNARENIIQMAQVAPSRYKYKIFIIDEAHMLSTAAFNALLKTIEEPPSYVVFILCTTEVYKMPLTIISRCQRFNFKKIGFKDISDKLEKIVKQEKIKVEKKVLDSVARQSGGHMRDAESLLSQVIAIGTDEADKEITLEEANLVIPRSDLAEVINLIDFIGKKNTPKAIELVNNLITEGISLKIFITELVEILRKMMLAKTNAALAEKLGLELGESFEKKIAKISENLDIQKLIELIEEFGQAKLDLSKYAIPQLALELAIVRQTTASGQQTTDNKQQIIEDSKQTTNHRQTIKQASDKTIEQANNNQPQAPQTNSAISSDLNAIKTKWNEFSTIIQKTNPSVSFVLKACDPIEFNNNELTLAFKYKFHKDQIDRPEIKAVITKALSQIHGQTISVKTVLNENLEINISPSPTVTPPSPAPAQNTPQKNIPTPQENIPNPQANPQNNSVVNNVLNTFGGKIVG